MTSFPSRPVLSALVVLAAATPLAAQRSPDDAVLAAVRRLDSAWAAKDRAALEAVLAPGYVYFSSRGGTEDRAGMLALVTDTAYRVTAQRTELKVHRTGKAAVVASRWQGRGRWKRGGFADDQRCSLALAEGSKGWQVTSEHCTQIDRGGEVQARPEDVKSVDAIIAALYDVISGPAGQARDWDRMRSLFAPGARLIPTGKRPDGTSMRLVWTVEQYISSAGSQLEKDGFFEREIGRQVHRYGDIVEVFSAYDSKRTATDAAPFARGINSIQLHFDGTRWWVVTVFWEGERPDNPIPAEMLTAGR